LTDNSYLYSLNTTFNDSKVLFDDGISVLDAYWYLHVNILNKTNLPVENVTVTVYDDSENIVFEGETNVNGWIIDIAVHEYTRNNTTTTIFTPHNITATKTGVGSAKQSNVTMDCTKSIALILYNTVSTLTAPSVFPEEHDIDIMFNYIVSYTDEDNDAPEYVRVNISGVLRPSNEHWGAVYDMKKVDINDTTYNDGCNYYFSTRLPKGNFTYRFETMDWQNTTATTIFCGPNITNRAPFIYPIIDQTSTVGMPYICQVNATDDDNDTLTYSLLEWPSGMRINSTTGLITWMPLEEQVGDNNVTVEVSDNDIDGMCSLLFFIRVHVNYPPILLKSLPDISFDEDTILSYALNLSECFVDLNPEDAITYSYYGAVNVNVTINLNATVNFSAAPGWSGTEKIIFRTNDPGGGYAEDSIDVIVNPVNDPPVADAGANQTVIANKTYGKVRLWGTASDPDGSISLYEWDFEGDGTYDWSFPYSGCTVYTYEVNGTYNATLRVTDNEGETAIDTCTITALELGFDLPIASAKVIDRSGHWDDNVFRVEDLVEVSGEDSHDPGWYNITTEAHSEEGENGTIVGYDWDWRDLTSHNGTCNATHRYGRGQEYEIVLTVYDNQSFTNTTTYTILVVYGPTADAGPNKEVKMDTSVTLYGRGYFEDEPHGAIVNYTWEFGDGNHGFGASITHSYILADGEEEHNYTANLTVTDNYGFTGRDSCIIHVVRNYLPIAEVGPSREIGTGGTCSATVTLNVRGYDRDGWIKSYTLNFGDGTDITVASSEEESSVSGTHSNTYYVTEEEGEKIYTATLKIVDNQNGIIYASCTITMIWDIPPEVCIIPSSKLTFGRRNVTIDAMAWDRDDTISGGSWSFEYLEYVPSLDITRRVWCNPESSSSNGLGTSSASFNATKFYDKYDKLTSFNVKIIVSDSAGVTSTAVGTIMVYPNQIPVIYGNEKQIVYTTQESEEVVFTAIIIDLDIVSGEDMDVSIEFGDGSDFLVPNIMLKNLTEEQKNALKDELAGSVAVDPKNNPLFRWLGDCMLMLQLGFGGIGIDVELEDVYYEWLEGETEITVDDLKNMWIDIIRGVAHRKMIDTMKRVEGLIEAIEVTGTPGGGGYIGLGAWGGGDIGDPSDLLGGVLDVSEIPGGEDVGGLVDFLFWLIDVSKALPTFMTTPTVEDFMTYMRYDMLYRTGLSSTTVFGVTMDELIENARQIVINYTYTGIVAPAEYKVNVSVVDVDGGEGSSSSTVLFINNFPPVAAATEIHGRINNATFKCYALDYERNIVKWEWDFDGDGEFDWNMSGSWTGMSVPSGFPMADKFSDDTLQNCTVEGPEVNIATMGNFSFPHGGVYDATLRVTDHLDYFSYITVKVYIYPIADAGEDKTYRVKKDVPFNGLGKTLDAEIREYKWDFDNNMNWGWDKTFRPSGKSVSKGGHTMASGWFNTTWEYKKEYEYIAIFGIEDETETGTSSSAEDICIVTITPNHPPVANAGPDQTVKWNHMPVHFDGSNSYDIDNDALTYTWDFGDGCVCVNCGAKPTHIYSDIGVYTVILNVSDDELYSIDICQITVTPDAGPDQTVWIGTNVSFNGSGPSTVNGYIWNFGDGGFSTGEATNGYANVTHMYNVPGKYTVTLTMTNTHGTSVSDECIITVIDNYIPEVSVGPEIGPAVGVGPHLQTYWSLPLTFYATACDRAYPNGSIVRYIWDFGDGTIVEGDAKQDQFYYYFNYTYTYSWFGEYVVNLTVWDERGASNWTTCNVTIVNHYGDIFSPVGTVITLIEDTYSYQGTVTFVINVRDDTDRKPYVDVWLDGKWYLKENYTINRTYYNTTVEITINMSTLSLG
ncbi:MAG: PKD domain-containing protein, partial [Thermoplasmatales archaeon]|nr:PKD domain-containing protein [Thermoplasmatales archaeon]